MQFTRPSTQNCTASHQLISTILYLLQLTLDKQCQIGTYNKKNKIKAIELTHNTCSSLLSPKDLFQAI